MGLLDTIKARLNLRKVELVGLDISTDAIILASLSKTKNSYVIKGLAMGPMPPDAINDGEITDTAGVAEVIRHLMEAAGMEAEQAVVAVGGQSAVIRLISLPHMPQTELDSYITYEAERYIPFAIDDVNISSQILVEPEEDAESDEMEVLLVAAQKTLVQSFVTTAEEAGLSLTCVDVSSFAVLRALERTDYLLAEGSTAALLIQGAITDINVLHEGIPKFNRSVFIGYTYLLENLINSLGLDQESAVQLLSEVDVGLEDYEGLSPEQEQATEILRPALSELAGEIGRSLDFYLSQGTGSLDRVVLAGLGASIKGLDVFLGARLGIEVVVGNPLSVLEIDGIEIEESQGPVYMTAIGLAMRGLDGA